MRSITEQRGSDCTALRVSQRHDRDIGGDECSGIDYGEVRFVIHQGHSRSTSHESGRAGRDGRTARSVIFTSKGSRSECEWIEQKETGHLTGGFKAMKEWVPDSKRGRRLGLGRYMDELSVD